MKKRKTEVAPASPCKRPRTAATLDDTVRSIFIGQLSDHATEGWLKKEFRSVGPVRAARVARDNYGRPKGYGFVDYDEAAHAKAATLRAWTDPSGRQCTVQLAKPTEWTQEWRPRTAPQHSPLQSATVTPISPPPAYVPPVSPLPVSTDVTYEVRNPPNTVLFVNGIYVSSGAQALTRAFCRFGRVIDVNLPMSSKGRPKGFAFVTFDSVDGAVNAVRNGQGMNVEGCQLRLDFSAGRFH